jgi:hypothetical protein
MPDGAELLIPSTFVYQDENATQCWPLIEPMYTELDLDRAV